MIINSDNQAIFTNIKWVSETTFEFSLDGGHFLFNEHFPNFPVVPASLIVELLHQNLAQMLAMKNTKLLIKNAKFLGPMVPGQIYRCQFQAKSDDVYLFTISDLTNKAYNKGLMTLEVDSRRQHAA
ncbi:hypothetical protein [Pseudoalteromonas sp. MMG012]|uniref:hypothetical protein n=1 Tax=Pseudoalteromonas sp. MMG012 TaxID=2822686 RepID=UPI001B39F53A|nr:hypothetical protein [Pseudoalteromonas sp. MMG012]MBQ4849995.1 hypothetical protein [Pseudoalteromonas sp. MMG012]